MNNVFLKEHGKRALNLFFRLRRKNEAKDLKFLFLRSKKRKAPDFSEALLQTARNRNRTGTGFNSRRILSPVRLPVPPLEHTHRK